MRYYIRCGTGYGSSTPFDNRKEGTLQIDELPGFGLYKEGHGQPLLTAKPL